MKTIENKQTNIQILGEGNSLKQASYFNLAELAINQPPKEGWTPVEMRNRMRVVQALKKAIDDSCTTCDLEDADMGKLKDCVAQFRGFKTLSQDAIDFYTYFESIK